MKSQKASITVHMVASLDGYVASRDQSVDWLRSNDSYAHGVELSDAAIEEFVNSIDCYVMGSRTYEQALELGWPYGEKPVYVLSKQEISANRETVHFHRGDVTGLIEEVLEPTYGSIWVVGGPMTVKSFFRAGMVDHVILSIMPVILGDGLHFFDSLGISAYLHLEHHTAYQDGMVELTYSIVR